MTKYKVPSRYDEYLICQKRGHDKTHYHNSSEFPYKCKYCGTLHRDVLVEENVPVPEEKPVACHCDEAACTCSEEPEQQRIAPSIGYCPSCQRPSSECNCCEQCNRPLDEKGDCVCLPGAPQGTDDIEQIREKYSSSIIATPVDIHQIIADIHTLLKEIERLEDKICDLHLEYIDEINSMKERVAISKRVTDSTNDLNQDLHKEIDRLTVAIKQYQDKELVDLMDKLPTQFGAPKTDGEEIGQIRKEFPKDACKAWSQDTYRRMLCAIQKLFKEIDRLRHNANFWESQYGMAQAKNHEKKAYRKRTPSKEEEWEKAGKRFHEVATADEVARIRKEWKAINSTVDTDVHVLFKHVDALEKEIDRLKDQDEMLKRVKLYLKGQGQSSNEPCACKETTIRFVGCLKCGKRIYQA